MKTLHLLLLLLAVTAFLPACGDKHADDHGHSHEDGDHSHEDGDDHAHDDEDHDHGEKHDLGQVSAEGWTVSAALFGEVTPGGEVHLDIDVDGGALSAVRGWIGIESGEGSMKGKVGDAAGHHHTHLEVPDPLPAGSQLWIEIEKPDGSRLRASLKLPTSD